jgi:hypothetical protein
MVDYAVAYPVYGDWDKVGLRARQQTTSDLLMRRTKSVSVDKEGRVPLRAME